MDLVEDKIVTVEHVATNNQQADIFTKASDASKFDTLRGKLWVHIWVTSHSNMGDLVTIIEVRGKGEEKQQTQY
jgi:hypothetical protein